MSDTWFNLRIFHWHFTIKYGDFFRMSVGKNYYHILEGTRWTRPIWIHELDLIGAWERR